MNIKLFDSEIKVMEVLWKEGDLTAKQLADILSEKIGWNKNTIHIPEPGDQIAKC